jgi:hypothetical protein
LRARCINRDRAHDDDLIDSVQVLLDRAGTLDELEGFGFPKAFSNAPSAPTRFMQMRPSWLFARQASTAKPL